MNIRSLFACGAVFLFASVAHAGSYQRTKDGQTLVWRDVPSRGDEATWSGKRDKDGFATGSGVLTWYKVEPTIVTGSNILDTRRYVVSISHYSGEMSRGKFKGAVTYVNANGRALEGASGRRTDRSSRRQNAARSTSRVARTAAKAEKTPTPSRARIAVDTPELTSAPTTPEPEQSPQSEEEPQNAAPPETETLAAQPTGSVPEQAPEQTPLPITQEQQTATPAETGTLVAKQMATPPQLIPEQAPSPPAPQQETVGPTPTDIGTSGPSVTPSPEQQATQLARNTNVQRPNRPDDSTRARSASPNEIPKPPPTIDEETVARLDTLYHSAVKANDAAIMDEILADDFVLQTDDGASLTKADLIKEAKEKRTTYEHQEVEKGTQKVRIWRDTAVVTALLNIKGTRNQDPFEYKASVSETYVRTPTGWRYVFGQTSKSDAQ